MSEVTKFTPVRGSEASILALPRTDGAVYFAMDTGKIYADYQEQSKIMLGGAGVAVLYGTATPVEDTEQDENITYYVFDYDEDSIENYTSCHIDDLILNQDGCFYKIISIANNKVTCERMAVSGSGSGTTTTSRARVTLTGADTSNFINGQPIQISVLPKSATEDGENTDVNMSLYFFIYAYAGVNADNEAQWTLYDQWIVDAESDVTTTVDLVTKARESTKSKVTVYAKGINGGESLTKEWTFQTHAMTLSEDYEFSALDIYKEETLSTFSIPFVVGGGSIEKVLSFYIDNELYATYPASTAATKYFTNTGTFSDAFTVRMSDLEHGVHTFKIALSQFNTKTQAASVTLDPIEYQLAIVKNEAEDPIIWFGDYENTYYSYDKIQIPYMVYDPASTDDTASLTISKGSELVSSLTINYTEKANNNEWAYFEIAEPEIDAYNNYYFKCGKTSARVNIYVATDPDRNMTLVKQSNLLLNFNPGSHSNDESIVNRQKWSYTDKNSVEQKATFSNFNWYNNGWVLDDDNDTCLRISNGASLSIPLNNLKFNAAAKGEQSCTFEFQFKIRNIQDYSNLVKEFTRYTIGTNNDNSYWAQFYDETNKVFLTEYDNYDTFLAETLGSEAYDSLEYAYTYKVTNTNAAVCSYYDGTHGICLGPQDGFFSTGVNTVNIKYVEDQMINLTAIAKKNDLLYMYINGILTSVAKITTSDELTIASSAIVFNSNYCDIDLYKCRVYNEALTVVDVDINYSVDHRDVLIYDETNLLAPGQSTTTGEYYIDFNALETFNENHPDNYTMPYMVITTSYALSNKLPYSKLNTIKVGAKFVNTGLERAYKTGELDRLAAAAGQTVEQYYEHHCPSWHGSNIDLVVQGTSSEFYPRRNYKMKTQIKTYTPQKDDEGNIIKYKSTKVVNMTMDGGPFKDNEKSIKTFYMDNDYVGTNKFTLKVDYMESSGSYNVGLANLVNTAYSTHPLQDYGFGEFTTDYYDSLRTNVGGYPILMFHEKTDADGNSLGMTYIGRYNMLLDKGSDDAYGFTHDADQLYVLDDDNQPLAIEDVAECWEFSDNARTYCSFRDPLNRKTFSFRQGTATDYSDEPKNSKSSCPIAADSFEYRYSKYGDFLDYIYDPENFNKKAIANADYSLDRLKLEYSGTDIDSYANRSSLLFSYMSNWEKACAWVWSTCIDNVPSLGTYTKIEDIGQAIFETNKYYVIDTIDALGQYTYKLCTDVVFNDELVYYNKDTSNNYTSIVLTNNADSVYVKNTFYYLQGSVYILADGDFDSSLSYYKLIESSNSTAETLDPAVTYNGITYYKDTKEYRLAKFKNEFKDHFNLTYSLIYFVITEVLMCYDSRGKNCMMASWGPQKASGEYIWYPIFYDMDTQLGINNTGIPSFEYYVNAHEDGCFSTNDSVLWANLYTCFFSDIKATYQSMRDLGKTLESVEHIEKWYTCQYDVTKSLASKGERPLIALNLDEWYKYISICNEKVQYLDKTGNLKTDTDNTYFYALQGDRSLSRQQFLSKRLNFIDGWLNYGAYSRSGGIAIHGRVSANDPTYTSDKWVEGLGLSVTGETISGLIPNTPYYETDPDTNETVLDAEGYPVKTNYLDADTFIELTPYQRSYVTIGGDNESLPSVECKSGSIRYTVPMADSIRTSGNYAEQLLYIYGANYLQSIGESGLMYWREFYAPDAPKLKSLNLGNDHPDFINEKLKYPTVAASSAGGAVGKPLLESVNFTGVKIDQSNDVNFDFTSSEKLKVFKGLRSNISSVNFADGVSLHTLYLPDTIKSLNLVEARKLTKLVSGSDLSNVKATTENFKTWTPPQGLYIAGLNEYIEDDSSAVNCNINTISIKGGSLGYDSYKLLNALYKIKLNQSGSQLAIYLSDVDWCPYEQLGEGAEYVAAESSKYFYADDHYRLVAYTYSTDAAWELSLKNGEIYKIKDDANDYINLINDSSLTMLDNMANTSSNRFKSTSSSNIPFISGTIYVNNSTVWAEEDIRTLQDSYPNVTFFFANVTAAYSAKFVRIENGIKTQVGLSQKLAADSDIDTAWFQNPYNLYDPEEIETLQKANYDFQGWSYNGTLIIDISGGDKSQSEIDAAWAALSLTSGVIDYEFVATFTVHKYKVEFVGADGSTVFETKYIPWNTAITAPTAVPWKDDSVLDNDENYGPAYTYKFIGYNTKSTATTALDLSTILIDTDYTVEQRNPMYAIFDSTPISVYDNVHTDYFAWSGNVGYSDANLISSALSSDVTEGYQISLVKEVTGKITIPATFTYNGQTKPVIAIDRTFNNSNNGSKLTHVFFQKNANGTANIKYFPQGESSAGLGGVFEGTKIKYVEFPDSLRYIGNRAFFSANCLTNTSFGTNTAGIGANAFNGAFAAGLGTIYVGSEVVYMGKYAIANNNPTASVYPFNSIIIGSATAESKLDLTLSNEVFIKENTGAGITVQYYGSTANKELLAARVSGGVTVS